MKSLFVVYHYDATSLFTVRYAFDAKGLVDSRPVVTEGFQSFDLLKDFVFELCRERAADRAVLVTFEQLNQAIEESSNADELLNVLTSKGESLENLDVEESRGLLGKIFGP